MKIRSYITLTVENPVAGSLSLLWIIFSWEMPFFESGDTKVFEAARNRLFASNEKQIDNHTLMFHMLHSYMYCKLCIPTIVDVSVKSLLGTAVVFC